VPFDRTHFYGNPFDQSHSVVQNAGATVRFYDAANRVAFGVGYGMAFDTTDRTAPRSRLGFQAGGVLLELHGEVPTSARSRLEITFGGIPIAHGTLSTNLGLPGAGELHDAVTGSQLGVTLRETQPLRGAVSLAYGVRYLDQDFTFAGTTKSVEANNDVLPFVELRLSL